MTLSIRETIQLLKYSFHFVLNLITLFIFFVIGLLFTLLSTETSTLGIAYLALGPMMLVQMYICLLYSGITKSSPKARFLELQLSDIISGLICIFEYIFLIVLSVIGSGIHPENTSIHAFNLIIAGITISNVIIYMSTAYKSFIGSIIFFTFFIMGIYTGTSMVNVIGFPNISILSGALFGSLALVAGFFISFLLKRLFYKKPLSKLAAGSNLRKYL